MNKADIIERIITKILKSLSNSNIELPHDVEIEISHHYELEQFDKNGAVLINLVKKENNNKYIMFFKGQTHPEHLHPERDESVKILIGSVDLYLDDVKKEMTEGKNYEIHKNVWHKFVAHEDSVIEEFSNNSQKDGSLYKDEAINQKTYNERKIKVVLNGKEYRLASLR